MEKRETNSSFVLGRILYTLLFVSLQAAALIVMFRFFRDQFAYFYGFCVLLSIAATLHILNNDSNPAYKIAWLIPILLFPIFGGLFYLLFGKYRMTRRQKEAGLVVQRQIRAIMSGPESPLEDLYAQNPEAALHARYILNATGSPPSTHTQTEYFPIGEKMYEAMLRELENAKTFIFMEYFIIQEGVMWNGILDILERKAREGLDIRVMYDDLGCLFTLPRKYWKLLQRKGIRACVFNPFNSILSPRFNNRDHRKICVIDGNVAFTGGINLADEYINVYEKHGHWKDTGILLRGEAVWSFTVQFLAMWDFSTQETDEFANYAPERRLTPPVSCDGYLQPYTDIPLDGELVGKTVYLNLINRAQRYVYITTPYLIIDNEMMTALSIAAKSGVDVRIITPHVPDKKAVFFLTRSYYDQLLRSGVKIYEYTPGFIHAKTLVADDDYGVVGTINLDYRSLYLHVECAVWMYRNHAIMDMKQDFFHTLECSEEISLEKLGRPSGLMRLWRAILRAFAPLA